MNFKNKKTGGFDLMILVCFLMNAVIFMKKDLMPSKLKSFIKKVKINHI